MSRALSFLSFFSLWFIVFCPKALAQHKIVFFSDSGKFQEKQSIAYGSTILVEGQSSANYHTVELEIIVNNKNAKNIEVDISGNRWYAVVAPFPIGANVIFTVRETVLMSNNGALAFQQEVLKVLENAIADAYRGKLKQMKFEDIVFSYASSDLSLKWQMYRLPSGERLDSAVFSAILKSREDIGATNGLLNFELKPNVQKSLIKFLDKSTFAQKLIDSADTQLMLDSVLFFSKVDTLLKDVSEEDARIIRMDLNEAYNERKEVREAIVGLKSRVLETALLSAKRSFTVSVNSSSQEVLGLQKYVGTDLGMMLIPGLGKAPVFALFSPHLTKIDPDKDYCWKKHGCKYFFALSLGIGLGQGLEGLQPVYYTGLSFRQNTAVRYHAGAVYYSSSNRNGFDAFLGLGVSLSLHYLPDFLRVLSTAQSDF